MRWLRASIPVAFFAILTAHVGSPNVVFEGSAGPYFVNVVVRPPDVVPGLAEVIVRLDSTARDVSRVTIRPVFWKAGVEGAPSGDDAKPVAGQTGLYSGQLWLMSRGAYSVYVTVAGAHGSGTAIVPVNAFATGRLGLSKGLSAILVVLGLVLVAGFVTIVRAASGEALLEPGETASPAARRKARAVATVAATIIGVALLGGAKWWSAVDRDYQRTMYRPPAVDAAVQGQPPGNVLSLRVHDTAAFHALFARVIPDHGKMMHLFVVNAARTYFGHFHPAQTDSLAFTGALTGTPAGLYRVFGDIVLANGLSQTVTTQVNWPGDAGLSRGADEDDSWWSVESGVATASTPASIGDGFRIEWSGAQTIDARTPLDLRFVVRNAKGEVASLQPYLGMAAHAVVLSSDDSVFIHLHPMGTVSTAAQAAFAARDRGDTLGNGHFKLGAIDDTMSAMHGMATSFDGKLAFPYEFPKPGRYRIWVQVKPDKHVLTGAFDIDVR